MSFEERLKALAEKERQLVYKVCEEIGYGNAMHICEQLWAKKNEELNIQ